MGSYPVFLQIKYFRCLIIGGGRVATRKVHALLAAGALPVVIAPEITEELRALITQNHLEWICRAYQTGDTIGFDLIVAATNSAETNGLIRMEAISAKLLINDVTDPDGSNFHVPATVCREPLQMAIGTSGEVPYLSHKIKEYFERKLDANIGDEISEIQKRRLNIIEKAAGNELLKKQLLAKEVDPLIERFLNHFV